MASRSAKKATDKKMKKTPSNLYNAKGSPEAAEAEDETASMKKGGKVEGKMAKGRADKPSRHKRAAGGRTPYTSGHMTESPSESGKTESGHEGQRP